MLLGDGAGSFGAATIYAADAGPNSIAVGDFNGDVVADLAVAGASSDNVSVLLGDELQGFAPRTLFAVGDQPVSIAVSDFDGDLDIDLAVVNAGIVSVLLNTTTSGNHVPSAADDTYSHYGSDTALAASAAGGVLSNDSDPDGDALTAALVSGPSHGSLTLNSDGSFTYQPNEDFVGQDSFSYTASDGSPDSGLATATITVGAGCDARPATITGTPLPTTSRAHPLTMSSPDSAAATQFDRRAATTRSAVARATTAWTEAPATTA